MNIKNYNNNNKKKNNDNDHNDNDVIMIMVMGIMESCNQRFSTVVEPIVCVRPS